uniref:Uncharacterized protein n=1 Tax=Bartonella schoenbuchensis (strain DSM 13525 / NCTC 13165 / R1) TaxID=687861 RepID=E6Z1C2_BARSR|nr:hypothetical protein BARSC_190183 [Bartonella schoenbuchensis R1]
MWWGVVHEREVMCGNKGKREVCALWSGLVASVWRNAGGMPGLWFER